VTLDDFLGFLDKHGIAHRTTQSSIILHACPSCGSEKDKVWLYQDRPYPNGPFFGKCMKCEEKFNSKSYLIAHGIEVQDVRALHGFDGELNLDVMPVIDILGKNLAPSDLPPETIDISDFVPIPSWPDHPAACYAIKRGFTPVFGDRILLDYAGSAVVFVVREGGQPVGYQRRFLRPPFPDMKTMSSRGFKKLEWVLEFPNEGDICVCEGPFTALSAWHFGYHAICTFGSGVGEKQISKISKLSAATGKAVGVAFDLDDAGKKGFRKISLSIFWTGSRVYRIRPEQGNDLNDSWLAGKGVVVVSSDEEDVTVPDLGIDFGERT
jgi:hypothetical protein